VKLFKIVICALLILLSGCSDDKTIQEEREINSKRVYDDGLNLLVNIAYVKDTRTGICFAYGKSHNQSYSQVLTAVDCSKIPANMLRELK
jgi:hypothetical protein